MTLTSEIASKLLSSYPRGVWVRIPATHTSKTRSQHKGHGRLLSVKGGVGEVLPAKHRKSEHIQLSELAFWKSRTLAINGVTSEDPDAIHEAPFVIVSPYGRFWNGRKFVHEIDGAVLYDNSQRCRQGLTRLLKSNAHEHMALCGAVQVNKVEQWLAEHKPVDHHLKPEPKPVVKPAPVHHKKSGLREAIENGLVAVELFVDALQTLAASLREALDTPGKPEI